MHCSNSANILTKLNLTKLDDELKAPSRVEFTLGGSRRFLAIERGSYFDCSMSPTVTGRGAGQSLRDRLVSRGAHWCRCWSYTDPIAEVVAIFKQVVVVVDAFVAVAVVYLVVVELEIVARSVSFAKFGLRTM